MGITYGGVLRQVLQRRDLQPELARLGELAEAGAQRAQVVARHVGRLAHHVLALYKVMVGERLGVVTS